MIQGRKKLQLTIETVLERTTELIIFQYYIPDKQWKLNEVMCSPLRKDVNPSFLVGNKYGNITFKDFSVSEHSGDCFKFVKILYNLPNLDAVLRHIDSSMGLGIESGSIAPNKPISQNNYKQEINKRTTLLQVITRKFTLQELSYWNSYLQSEGDLKREEVYSIKKVYLNKKLLSVADLRFGYYYNGTWKIYQPNENKRKKWLTNTSLTYLEGKENIKNCDTAWVTKSKKDKMCLLKLFSCVAATQNESISCYSQENVDFIKNNSKNQVILYDSDDAGVRSCQEITKKFSFGYCNPPRKYLEEGIKDFSDLLKTHGIKAIEEHLREKQLI